MQSRDKVYNIFVHLEAFVERQFGTKIKELQSDGGTEFLRLSLLLFPKCYHRKISYPCTLSKWGCRKEKHAHH